MNSRSRKYFNATEGELFARATIKQFSKNTGIPKRKIKEPYKKKWSMSAEAIKQYEEETAAYRKRYDEMVHGVPGDGNYEVRGVPMIDPIKETRSIRAYD